MCVFEFDQSNSPFTSVLFVFCFVSSSCPMNNLLWWSSIDSKWWIKQVKSNVAKCINLVVSLLNWVVNWWKNFNSFENSLLMTFGKHFRSISFTLFVPPWTIYSGVFRMWFVDWMKLWSCLWLLMWPIWPLFGVFWLISLPHICFCVLNFFVNMFNHWSMCLIV